jgi:hypothetical protein
LNAGAAAVADIASSDDACLASYFFGVRDIISADTESINRDSFALIDFTGCRKDSHIFIHCLTDPGPLCNGLGGCG